MALNQARSWLIAYDICDKKRLSRLGRFIRKHAIPVQYSLYCYEGSAAQLGRLMQDIATYIDPRQDDVRAYQLPESPRFDVLGRGSLPTSVGLLSSGTDGLERLLHPARANEL